MSEYNVKLVPIQDIIIPERSREDYGDLSSLKTSIQSHGLLNAIILNSNYELCAGGRRLRAHQELGFDSISARIIPELSPEDSLVIEWIENEGRKDFTWAEDVKLKDKIHQSFAKSQTKWGYRETAKYIGVSLGSLSTDLELAKALSYFPELSDMKTKSQAREAYKKLASHAEAIQAESEYSEETKNDLESIISTTNSTPETSSPLATEEDLKERENADSGEPEKPSSSLPEFAYHVCSYDDVLHKFPEESIGFAELDPPYAIDFENTYGQAAGYNTAEGFNDWSLKEYIGHMSFLLNHLYDKLCEDAWILCWCGREYAYLTNGIAEDAGFKTQHPGVWMKSGGSSNNLKANMCSNYETFLLFRKGTMTFNTAHFNAAIYHETLPHTQKFHPTQKPLDLYRRFFEALHKPKRLFFAPFAGSGASVVVAPEFNMKPIGTETEQKYYYQFMKAMRENYA